MFLDVFKPTSMVRSFEAILRNPNSVVLSPRQLKTCRAEHGPCLP